MNTKKLGVLCSTALLGGMVGMTTPAIADDDAMMKMIEIMYEKGSITKAEYNTLKQAAEADAEKQAETSGTRITPQEKLEIKSADGAFEWDIGGRLQADYAVYDTDGLNTDAFGGGDGLADGGEIRRARIAVKGKLWDVWNLKVQADFNEGAELKDGWLSYNGWDSTAIKFGQFKEPFGLEELTSSKYDTMHHESTVTQAFAPSRAVGIGAHTVMRDMFTLNAGVFGEEFESDGDEDGGSWGVTGRGTFSPIHTEDRALHFGIAGSWRSPDQADGFGAVDGSLETHVDEPELISTGGFNADDFTLLGLEAAGVWNRFSLQGEYMRQEVSRPMGGDLSFDGYYVMASVFLTDDRRPYDFKPGDFDKVNPKNKVGKGGYGAWEIAARFSSLDLSDADVINPGITGGELDNVSLALNWYANKNVRFLVSYNAVVDNASSSTFTRGIEPASLETRAQIFW